MSDDTPDWLLLEDVVVMIDNKIKHSEKAQKNPANAAYWKKCREAVMRAKARENQREYSVMVKKDLAALGFKT